MGAKKMGAARALRLVDAGARWQIKSEAAHILNFKTGETSFRPGARLYVEDPVRDRFVKTEVWLVPGPDKPDIAASVLRSFANLFDPGVRVEGLTEEVDG